MYKPQYFIIWISVIYSLLSSLIRDVFLKANTRILVIASQPDSVLRITDFTAVPERTVVKSVLPVYDEYHKGKLKSIYGLHGS